MAATAGHIIDSGEATPAVRYLARRGGYSIANSEVSRRVKDLAGLHADPADRFLAATALVYELTLVTLDGRLVTTDWLPTLTG